MVDHIKQSPASRIAERSSALLHIAGSKMTGACVVLMMVVGLADAAKAQFLPQEAVPTRSGSATSRTCTQLRNDCDHRGFIVDKKAAALQAARCARYWDFCIKSGIYHDGRRTITGVIRE